MILPKTEYSLVRFDYWEGNECVVVDVDDGDDDDDDDDDGRRSAESIRFVFDVSMFMNNIGFPNEGNQVELLIYITW